MSEKFIEFLKNYLVKSEKERKECGMVVGKID